MNDLLRVLGISLAVALGCGGCAGRAVPPRKAAEQARPAPSRPVARRSAPAVSSPGPPSSGRAARNAPRTPPRRARPSGVNMITWRTTATSLRGRNGQRVTYGCPAGGSQSNLWGTGVYTDDSSICSAAVHAGLITFGAGGVVTLEVLAGRRSYPGSTRHGVVSGSWGPFSGSFVFVGSARALPPRPAPRGGVKVITWSTNARAYRNQTGKRYTFRCPAGGHLGSVWGSAIYTDDSSICSAAVHAGLITVTAGGQVTLQLQPGQSAYQGSTRFGVTSSNWNAWTGSFIFLAGAHP